MEANVARYYTFKGVSWEYEPEIFHFPKGSSKLDITAYCPDFKIRYGHVTRYVEVKGSVDNYCHEKAWLLKRFYPWVKLDIIGPFEYSVIRKRHQKQIKNWE